MFRFNSDNIYVGQIKEILNKYNLPTCKVLNDGEKVAIYENLNYIYDNKLLKARTNKRFDSFEYNPNDFAYLSIYTRNEDILNVTHTMPIKNNYYDSATHKYLGDFLRYIRDFEELDLMSMYNCFCGQTASNLYIKMKDNTFNSKDASHKLYIVPVKFWKKYTIAIDSYTDCVVMPIFYRNGNLVNSIQFDASEILDGFYEKCYMRKTSTRFSVPFVYDKLYNILDSFDNDRARLLYEKECDLCLLIKVAQSNDSSLVVLEGDYTRYVAKAVEVSTNKIDSSNFEEVNLQHFRYPNVLGNYDDLSEFNSYYNRLQLLNFNDRIHHPFADRLVEYLSQNAITPLDDITNNLRNIQIGLNKNNYIASYTPYFSFTNDIRASIYLGAMNDSSTTSLYNKFDVLGYVDKDIETNMVKYYGYDDFRG